MSDQNIQPLFRLRVEYVKEGRLAYLGHLEVIHTIERIVRRAGLPYAVTQGFSPHMRVGFSSALPVGTSSESEWYDVFLTQLVPAPDALERLRAASPEDLMVKRCGYIDVRTPALTAQITAVRYRVDMDLSVGDRGASSLREVLSLVTSLQCIPYMRGKKSKVMDLDKTLIACRETEPVAGFGFALELDTHCDNDGALRPEIFLAALDRAMSGDLDLEGEPIQSTGIQDFENIARYRVRRMSQLVALDDGLFASPLD